MGQGGMTRKGSQFQVLYGPPRKTSSAKGFRISSAFHFRGELRKQDLEGAARSDEISSRCGARECVTDSSRLSVGVLIVLAGHAGLFPVG